MSFGSPKAFAEYPSCNHVSDAGAAAGEAKEPLRHLRWRTVPFVRVRQHRVISILEILPSAEPVQEHELPVILLRPLAGL